MKKYLLCLMTAMFVAIVIFNLVSCGGGNDDDYGDGTGVVGIWDGNAAGDKVVATFRSNGSGTLEWTIYDDETYFETESFTYVKNTDSSGTMTVNRADDDSDGGRDSNSGSSTYTLKYSIAGDAMVLEKSSGSFHMNLTRRK